MKVIFGVIMLCYNSSLYVDSAISSVIEQTYSNWELIVINDSLTDNALDIVNQYAEKDHRNKVFSKCNGGYVFAVNTGLEKVTGDFFINGYRRSTGFHLFMDIKKHITNELPDMITFRSLIVKDENICSNDALSYYGAFSEMYQTTIRKYEKSYPAQSRILFVRDTQKALKYQNLVIYNILANMYLMLMAYFSHYLHTGVVVL